MSRCKVPISLLMVVLLAVGALGFPVDRGFAQGASNAERMPLPVPPAEMDHYELKFSRPLTAEEQQIWDTLWHEAENRNTNLYVEEEEKRVFYTERAHEMLINGNIWEGDLHRYRSGDGEPGTVLLDFGTVTVCIGDVKLTRKKAIPLVSLVAPFRRDTPAIDTWYKLIYSMFSWTQPFPGDYYSETRFLVSKSMPEPTEFTRYYQLMADYMLRGRRADAPIPTSETPDGSLWYDEAVSTFHLPMQYTMTDQELLQYIDMTTAIERRAAMGAVTDIIGEQQAIELARQWTQKLYGVDVSALSTFAFLTAECSPHGCAREPRWEIVFAPEDYLLRRFDGHDFDFHRILLDAPNGELHLASSNADADVPAASGRAIKKLKTELKPKATAIAAMLLPDGEEPGEVTFYTDGDYGHLYLPLRNNAKKIPQSIYCALDGPDGGTYRIEYASGNLALMSFHFEAKDYGADAY